MSLDIEHPNILMCDLPEGLLADLAAAAGLDQALECARLWGGERLYVPKSPRSDWPQEWKGLIDEYGGCGWYVPSLESIRERALARCISRSRDVRAAARRYGISYRRAVSLAARFRQRNTHERV